MKKMQFLPELAKFLKEHQYIYTVRRYHYSLLEHYVEVEGVGKCERARVATIYNQTNLEPWVHHSGFTTIDDWWRKIKELNKGYGGPYYLYEVTVEEDKGEPF